MSGRHRAPRPGRHGAWVEPRAFFHTAATAAAVTALPADLDDVFTEEDSPMATHTCPGCGQPGVPDRMFACRVDWYRLPRPIRNTIWSAHRRDPAKHAQAMATARAWYAANPPRQRANPAETRGAALRLMRGELPA